MDFLLRPLLALIYVLWLPVMLAGRLFGRDPLQRRRPETSSYWLVRPTCASRESYFSEASEIEGRLTFREGNESAARVGNQRSPLLARLLRTLGAFYATQNADAGRDAGEQP